MKLDEYDHRRGREGRAWRAISNQIYQEAMANLSPCWRCGQPIDYSARKASTPMSYTTGHRQAMVDGGHPTDPDNLAPEHALCNFRDGARLTNRKRTPTRLNTSRAWY